MAIHSIQSSPTNKTIINRTMSDPTGTAYGRKVKKSFNVLKALTSFFDNVAGNVKSLGDFLCKYCTLRNFTKAGREVRHQAKQAKNELQRETESSKVKRGMQRCGQVAGAATHRIKGALSDVKNAGGKFFDRLKN